MVVLLLLQKKKMSTSVAAAGEHEELENVQTSENKTDLMVRLSSMPFPPR